MRTLLLANTTLGFSLLLTLGAHPPNSRLAPVPRLPRSSSQPYRDQVPPTRGRTGSAEPVQQWILRTQPDLSRPNPPWGSRPHSQPCRHPAPSVAVSLHRGQGLAANEVGSRSTASASEVSPATQEGPHSPKGHPWGAQLWTPEESVLLGPAGRLLHEATGTRVVNVTDIPNLQRLRQNEATKEYVQNKGTR